MSDTHKKYSNYVSMQINNVLTTFYLSDWQILKGLTPGWQEYKERGCPKYYW